MQRNVDLTFGNRHREIDTMPLRDGYFIQNGYFANKATILGGFLNASMVASNRT
jgi:hypothetical protein